MERHQKVYPIYQAQVLIISEAYIWRKVWNHDIDSFVMKYISLFD